MAITQVTPYIHFNGNAAEAIRHYQQVLGATATRSMTYGEMPGNKPRPENASRILHCELQLGSSVLMLSDAPADHEGIIGSNVEVSLAFDDEAEMRKAYDGLAAEGKVVMAVHEAFWGGKFGMLVDRFGIHWMFSYHAQ